MQALNFFWERSRCGGRSRFDMLLMEYGEYFIEDYGSVMVPIVSQSRSFRQCLNLRKVGRLHLCTRSIVFEPEDTRFSLIRLPFRFMANPIEPFTTENRDRGYLDSLGLDYSGFFSINCTSTTEMKANGTIGPYRIMEASEREDEELFMFVLVHSELGPFVSLLEKLRVICKMSIQGDRQCEAALQSLLRERRLVRFDSSSLVDYHEKLLLPQPIACNRVTPLLLSPGVIMVTDCRVYFQPARLNNIGGREAIVKFTLSEIARLFCRRFMQMQTGLEVFLTNGTSILFCFESRRDRDAVYAKFAERPELGNALSSNVTMNDMTRKWQAGDISNFDYLMHLNYEADRSLNDITQYPVFPWVIADYSSEKLNYRDPAMFRDLSKPIGALNPTRLQSFIERYESMPTDDIEVFGPSGKRSSQAQVPFLYGTHYSTPGYVLFYLVRKAPEYMLCLQGGRYDVTDRMFLSVKDSFESILSNQTDLKELIPEFYCGSGEFLTNVDNLDLGYRHTGERMHDVVLPPWAKSPRDYIRKCAKALESDYVSDHLHDWIDLIFGYKQRGQAAIDANNLFYYLTYEGSIDLELVDNPMEKRALEIQIQEFGQTPKQLFKSPHPARNSQLPPPVLAEVAVNPINFSNNPFDSDYMQNMMTSPRNNATVTTHNSNNGASVGSSNSAQHHPTEESILAVDPTRQTAQQPPTGSGGFLSKLSASLTSLANSTVATIGKGAATSSSATASSAKTDQVKTAPVATQRKSTGTSSVKTQSMVPSPTAEKRRGNVSSLLTGYDDGDDDDDGGGQFLQLGADFDSEVRNFASGGGTSVVSPSSKLTAEILSEMSVSNRNDNSNSNSGSSNPTAAATSGIRSRTSSTDSKGVAPKRASSYDMINVRLIERPRFEVHKAPITCAFVSQDESFIASSSRDSSMKISRLSYTQVNNRTVVDNCVVRRTFTESDAPLSCCGLSSNGKLAAAGSWDNSLYLYSVDNACLISKITAHADGIADLHVSSSDQYIATAAWDTTVKLWQLAPSGISRRPMIEFYDLETSVQSLRINSEGNLLAAGTDDGSIVIWDIRTGMAVASTKMSSDRKAVTCLRWLKGSGEGKSRIICSSASGCISLLEADGTCIMSTQKETGIKCLAYDGRALYGGGTDGSISGWSMHTGMMRDLFKIDFAHEGGVNTLNCVEPSSSQSVSLLVSGGDDGCVRTWTIDSNI